MLQREVAEEDPEQLFPPFDGRGLLHCLVLVRVPPPQVALQPDQLDQRPQLPSTVNNNSNNHNYDDANNNNNNKIWGIAYF